MKVELNIPESLNDITIEQYQTFLLIEEPTPDDLLSVFLNISKADVNKIKDSEVDRLVIHINSLFEVEQKHKLRFNFNGTEYGFIPDLDAITYGENKDITSYINDWQQMHKAMSVLYRPITNSQKGKYLIQEYEGTRFTADKFKDCPLDIAFGAMVFFYNLTNELLKAIPNFIQKEAEKELMRGQISAENGEAIKNSIHSLRATLEDLERLQSYHYISA